MVHGISAPYAWQHVNFYGRYEFTTRPDPIDIEAVVEALTQMPIIPMEDDE
ncbi:MAG: hypothetical protein NVS2B7_39490 [Herpetosiphon sp.]